MSGVWNTYSYFCYLHADNEDGNDEDGDDETNDDDVMDYKICPYPDLKKA